ncbi:MAG TPA: maleylpyruvate isomerase N-terminal domain-containing protein [Candidatus Deferrimicrobiaceae bacterium]|nr:maleylpyruvate isomerase N-terminal domain-containing protein [Candidatus Deferrimicrobiaceae bacterium]
MAGRRPRSLESWRRDALRRIVASREATLAFVARLPEREVRRPRTLDRWSIKDVLGHLLGCDEETVRRFRLIARGHAERIHWFEDMAAADRFNARCVARFRRLGMRGLLRRRARGQAELVRWLRRLPSGALRDPAHEYPMTQWLPAPGWSHERDHLAEIRAWWQARSRRR